MASFKVGDRVECYPGPSAYPPGVVVRTDEHGTIVMHDDGREGLWHGGLRLIAPAPPVTRPIQPGDYIKDPGARPVDAEPLRVGDVVYITAPCLLVQSLSDVSRSPAIGDIVRYAQGGWDPIGNVRRLPPDAVLDEARSPRRDGKAAFAEAVRAASCKHDRSCPIDCAKWSDVIAKVNAQAALLSRALILVSGLNLQHHSSRSRRGCAGTW